MLNGLWSRMKGKGIEVKRAIADDLLSMRDPF